ncbi:uncharacterized protein BJX67DRAFT_380152 [Aspergillus lucknowensis]|uniref:Pentatricopeptide repeat domain-containing protein n=1 Tax=Aspergillus lucknowensis TaxID=176173 RepID=A0ABR4LYC9_9EURO
MSIGSAPTLLKVDTGENAEHSARNKAPATATSASGSRDAVKDGYSTQLVGANGIFDAFAGLKSENDEWMDLLFDRPWRFITRRDALRRNRRGISREQVSRDTAVQGQRALRHKLPPRENRKVLRRAFWMRKVAPEERVVLYKRLRKMLEAVERRGEARDWKTVNPASKRESQRREILVPDETVAILAGISKEFMAAGNIWYVLLHHGCKVHVLPAAESVGQYRKVILSGSDWVTKLIESRIKQTQELQERGDALIDIRKPPVPVFPSLQALERKGSSPPLVRGVWHLRADSRPPVLLNLVVSNSKSLSTVRDFVEHVEQLTNSLPGSNTNGPPHPKRVALALWALFTNEEKRHLISTTALNIAVSFLVKHGLRSYAQGLFVRGEHVLTIDTFNILLNSAASRQHLPFFSRVLRIMARLRIRPNASTWLAYLDCLVSPTARTNLVRQMEQKGYLQDPTVMRQVLLHMIQDLFAQHLKDGRSVDEFVRKAVKTVGRAWFPASLTTQMFRVTAQLRDVSAMRRLLEVCKENGLPVTSATICQVIRFFPNDTFSALDCALQCLENANWKLSKEAYEQLFLNAFRNRHYNICRVLWRYACMDGAVTYGMRSEVSFFLTQNVGKKGVPEQENIWRTSAGKVIVGVDLHLPKYPLQKSLLKNIPTEFHGNPVSSLMGNSMLQGVERTKQRRAATAIIKHDIEIGSWYTPKYPLANMLEAAAQLDKEWSDVPRPRNWLMQNAIHVPVELVGHNL